MQLLRRKQSKGRFGDGGNVKQRAAYPNHVWSYDFTQDRTTHGQKIRTLAVMDEYTRESLLLYAATSIPSKRVWDILQWLFSIYGVPEHLRSDNGPEFIATDIKANLAQHGCQTIFIQPGHPWENPFIERFIGTLRHECLDRYLFDHVPEAQHIMDHWRIEYNQHRPHSSLDYRTPAEFAQRAERTISLTRSGT